MPLQREIFSQIGQEEFLDGKEEFLPPQHHLNLLAQNRSGWKSAPGKVPKLSAEAAQIVEQAVREGWSDVKIIHRLQRYFPRLRAHFDDIDMFCTHLDCSRSNISVLPPFSRLEVLDCSSCFFLQVLPDLPRLRCLERRNCPNLALTAEMMRLDKIVVTGSYSLSMPDNCQDETVLEGIRPWQEQGLMPQDAEGRILLWKCVSPTMRGNLGFRYVLGQEFQNTGMACAGPFGALKDWDLHRKAGSRVMAIWATCIMPVDTTRGIYRVLRGTPAAVYLARDITREGFIPLFFDGDEDEYIESVLYGDEDEKFDPENLTPAD